MSQNLSHHVEQSETSGPIKNETLKILEDTAKLCEKVWDPEKAAQIRKECEDVRMATKNALKGVYNQTHWKLAEIKQELLTGPQNKIDQNEIIEIRREHEELQDIAWESQESDTFSHKEFSTYSKSDASKWLKIIKSNYSNYNNFTAFSWYTTNLDDIMWPADAHVAQEALLKVLHGDKFIRSWFSWNNIHGFSTERWGNFSISKQDIEKEFRSKDPSTWNSLATANYLSMLESTWTLNLQTLSDTIWVDHLMKLKKLWSWDSFWVAKQKISANADTKWLLDDISSIDFDTLLTSPKQFEQVLNMFDSLDTADKENVEESLLIYLTEKISSIWELEKLIGNTDISWIWEWVYQKVVLKARTFFIAKKLSKKITKIYEGWPDVSDVLEAYITMASEWTDMSGFDFNAFNDNIHEYNEENNTNYALITGDLKQIILATTQNLFNRNTLASNYNKAFEEVTSIEKSAKSTSERLSSLKSLLRNETDPEKIKTIKADINTLQKRRVAEAGSLSMAQKIITDTDQTIKSMDISLEEETAKFDDFLKNAKLNTSRSAESLKDNRYDFNNPDIVESFSLWSNRERIKLIWNTKDLLLFIEKSPGEVRISEIHESLRGDFSVIRALKNLRQTDISLIPSEYFNFSSAENTQYGRLFILLTKAPYSEKLILDLFINENDSNETHKKEIADIVYGILTDTQENMDSYQKRRLKAHFETSGITQYLSDEQRSELWIQKNTNEWEQNSKRKGFDDAYQAITLAKSGSLWREDREMYFGVIKEYIDIYGIDNIKSQFRNLMISEKNIPFTLIQTAVPFIKHTPENLRLIHEWIKIRGNELVKSLHDSFQTDPTVIRSVLENCETSDDIKEILGYLHINSADNLVAVYRGLWDSSSKVINLLWNEFNKEELTYISSSISTGKFHKEDKTIVEWIITWIIQKNNKETALFNDLSAIKDKITENPDAINRIKNFLDDFPFATWEKNRILWEMQAEWKITTGTADIIKRVFNGDKEKIQVFLGDLLKATEHEIAMKMHDVTTAKMDTTKDKWILELLEINSEGKTTIGTWKKLKAAYIIFIKKHEWLSDTEKRKLFCDEYGITLESWNREKIIYFLTLNKVGAMAHAQKAEVEKLSQAIANWNHEEILLITNKISQAYDRWEIDYIPTPIEEIIKSDEEKKSTPTEKVNNSLLIWGSPEAPTIVIWGETINLDPEEAQAMKDNPEAMKNFINADTYFAEAWLTSIWRNFRKEIALAMNMSGGNVQINLNDNSLWKVEFIKFAQFSYKVWNGKNSRPSNRVWELQNQFKVYGDIHAKDKSLLWDTFISDLNTAWINRELTSQQIAVRMKKLAQWKGLSKSISKKNV